MQVTLALRDGLRRALGGDRGGRDALLDIGLAVATLGKRLLAGRHGLVELGDAALEHRVLDLGVADLLLEAHVGERLLVAGALGGMLVRVELGDGALGLAEGITRGDGCGAKLGDVGGELVELGLGGVKLRRGPIELGGRLGTLAHQGGQAHPHLGELVDHVLALLLQKAHIGVDAAEGVLHASALLAEVTDEQALLLEHRLELLELALLLVKAISGKLELRVGLLAAGGEVVPLALEGTQVVDGQGRGELGKPAGDVVGTLGLVDLALERTKLARDLAGDVLGATQVLVHALELAKRALLAAAMLGDARGLLDELATLLGAALQDGVELALRDDRVGLLAETGVVQDVLDVHQASGRAVDEVLGLTRAIHPARDADLVEVDWQGVIGVVEHEGDLGHADRLSRGGTGEDDVLHGLAAQHARTLLAQDPKDRVRDVGLARAVGTDDHGQAGVEDHVGSVREGLEALERE